MRIGWDVFWENYERNFDESPFLIAECVHGKRKEEEMDAYSCIDLVVYEENVGRFIFATTSELNAKQFKLVRIWLTFSAL